MWTQATPWACAGEPDAPWLRVLNIWSALFQLINQSINQSVSQSVSQSNNKPPRTLMQHRYGQLIRAELYTAMDLKFLVFSLWHK